VSFDSLTSCSILKGTERTANSCATVRWAVSYQWKGSLTFLGATNSMSRLTDELSVTSEYRLIDAMVSWRPMMATIEKVGEPEKRLPCSMRKVL